MPRVRMSGMKLVDPSLSLEAIAGAPSAYLVFDAPGRLAGMPYPEGSEDWRVLREEGFELVVCLTQAPPSYDPSPLRSRWLPLEDLVGGGDPVDPVRDGDNLRSAAYLALSELESGNGVLVHCEGGTGRSGTVLGVVMVLEGLSPEAAEEWLSGVHHRRGRPGWPESDWQRQQLREARSW